MCKAVAEVDMRTDKPFIEQPIFTEQLISPYMTGIN